MGIKFNFQNFLVSSRNKIAQFNTSYFRLNNYAPKEKMFFWMLFIILVYTVLKFIFVFGHSDYKNYLSSDMGGYWDRAYERFNGEYRSLNQWVIWPPFFHIILTNIFKINNLLGFFDNNLEIILSLNIILTSFSVVYLYRITERFAGNYKIAFIASTMYALTYYTFYYNAFILTENFAVPIVIASIYYLLLNKNKYYFLSGILLAIATGMRPGFGILGLPFALYALFSNSKSFKSDWAKTIFFKGAWKASVFTLGFIFILIAVITENNYISEGNLKGLGAARGVNKYFSFTKTYEVQSRFDGYYYVLIPPGTVTNPENGKLITDKPIYNSEYFNNLTREYIKENPEILVKKLKDFVVLYFGVLFPSVSSVLWFDYLFEPFRWFVFILSVFMVFSVFMKTSKRTDWKIYFLLLSVFFLSQYTCYMYNSEHRYVFGFMFTLYPVAVESISEIISNFKTYRKRLIVFSLVIILPVIIGTAFKTISRWKMENKIEATIMNDSNTDTIRNFNIDILNFPFKKELTHQTLGAIERIESFNAGFNGEFEMSGKGFLEFYIYCEESFEFIIDGDLIAIVYQNEDEKEFTSIQSLSGGKHSFRLTYFHRNYDVGFKAMYAPLFANDLNKYYFGEDSEMLKFKVLPTTE